MVGRRLRQLKSGQRLGQFRETYARSGATISNQILRHEGEPPPEIGGIEYRAGGRGEAGRFKIRFERIASLSRPRLGRLAWCALRPDAKAIAVARLSWTPKKQQPGEIGYTGRISKIGGGWLRTALYDAAQIILTKPLKVCSQLKYWAMRIARRAGMSKAKVGLARRLAVSCIACLPKEPPSTLEQSDRRLATVRAGHDARPSRSEVPSPGRWITLGRTVRGDMAIARIRLASLILFQCLRVAASRVDNAKRD
jgi:hypothetical protein